MGRKIEFEVGNWHTNSLLETAVEFELAGTPVDHKVGFVAVAVVVVAQT